MPSSRCSSPNPEDVIRLEDLIKKCPGAPKRKKKRQRGESGGGGGGVGSSAGPGTIRLDPIRGGLSRVTEAGGGGREGDDRERNCQVDGYWIRPQRLFHDEEGEDNSNNDDAACSELHVTRILYLSSASGSVFRAAPQDAAEHARER